MFSWGNSRPRRRMTSQKSQGALVAAQYGLLILSGVDSAGAVYLILGPGNEVSIAGASPILTAVRSLAKSMSFIWTETCLPGSFVSSLPAAPSNSGLEVF